MATKILTNLTVLLLAISQVVHIAATPRELLPPANPTTASSSLLVTSISGDSPSSGFEVSHGHGHGASGENKVPLDTPGVPAPSSPPLQGKKSTVAAPLLVTSVPGPSSAETTTRKYQICICPEKDPPCDKNGCYCCSDLEGERCFPTRDHCTIGCGCPPGLP